MSDRLPISRWLRRRHIEVLADLVRRGAINGAPIENLAMAQMSGDLNGALADYDATHAPAPPPPPPPAQPPLPPGWEPPNGMFMLTSYLPVLGRDSPLGDQTVDPTTLIVVPVRVPPLPYLTARMLSVSACEHGNTLDPRYMQCWIGHSPRDLTTRITGVNGGQTAIAKIDDVSPWAGQMLYYNLRFWAPDFNWGQGGISADTARTLLISGQWPY